MYRNKVCDAMRDGIRRSQDQLLDRMLISSSKSLQPAEVENNVILPILRPLGTRNIVGCITSIHNSMYTVGTPQGTISVSYTRNQFELCPSNVISFGGVRLVFFVE